MATERVERFIKAELVNLSAKHPDRPFLQQELDRFNRYVFKSKEAKPLKNLSLQEKLNRLLTRPDGLTEKVKRERREGIELWKERDGEDSIYSILPIDCLEFSHVMNPLLRGHISTKTKLAKLKEQDIRHLPGIGDKYGGIILAMRNVTRAEIKAGKQNPQNPV